MRIPYKEFKASIITVVFDEKYEFQDILHVGISKNSIECNALVQDEISRILEDFEPHKFL